MYTVLLVDDEPIVLSGISQLVSWQDFDTVLVGTAANGIGALEFIQRENPDIVVCDIQMPGMNGLEVISKAQAINPDAAYIVLSGYSEFKFAKRAIELGVRNYLLKPCNEVEIGQMLEQVVAELDQRRRKEDEFQRMQQALLSLTERMGETTANGSSLEEGQAMSGQSVASGHRGLPGTGNEVVDQMIEYVLEHFSDPRISLTHLSKHQLFMNPEYVGKLFRDTVGVRFSDYVMSLRIARAKELMQDTYDVTIAEIADRTGFGGNSQYFSQVFKRVTGCTPTSFKKERVKP